MIVAVIIFNSTHQALQAEKVLEDAGLSIDIVPRPPELSADCGLAIEFAEPDEPAIKALLADRRIEYAGIFSIL